MGGLLFAYFVYYLYDKASEQEGITRFNPKG